MRPDPQDVAKIIAETAQREMLPRFGRLATSSVYEKSGPNDLVTDVDYAMESALRSAFAELCPDADFIGEERAAADPAVMEGLAGPGRFWIVDPLDGTRNFVRGAAEFGTIVAFVEDGVTTMGWIYAAPDDAFAIAVKGSGASWTGPRPEKPRGDGGPRGMRSVGWLSDEFGHIGRNLRTEFRTDGSHCSAYAYIELLRGGFDFAVHSRIQPWDHAAGVLIVCEAGGRCAFLDAPSDYAPAPSADRPMLCVADAAIWPDVAARLTAAPGAPSEQD